MYQFATPTGLITVDHSCTVAKLKAMGAMPAKWEDICANARGESSDDYLMRFARKSAEQISSKRSSSRLDDEALPNRPVQACGRAALFSRND